MDTPKIESEMDNKTESINHLLPNLPTKQILLPDTPLHPIHIENKNERFVERIMLPSS